MSYAEENGIRVVFVTVPESDGYLWKRDGFDDFKSICQKWFVEKNCEYYDFNLLKDRYRLFSDSCSYVDEGHLCGVGSETFTSVFCDIIKKVDAGEDVSDLFYDSYKEMKQDSPYMEYYLAHKDDWDH